MKLVVNLAFLAAIIVSSFSGCAHEPAAIVPVAELELVAEEPSDQETAGEDAVQDEAADGSLGDKVSEFLQKAKATAPTLDGTKKWFSDTGEATGQSAEDTMKWVNETYKSLSDRGLTTAKDAGDWVSEDWNSMGAWEYKVVLIGSAAIVQDANLLESTLNEHGKQRWDCFHVSSEDGGFRFFMKRAKRSYLKNMPLRDVLKLVPLLNTDGGEGQ